MSILGTPFADGQLPASKGTLYTAPSGKTDYVKSISLVNTNASPQTTIIYIKRSGVSRVLARTVLAQWEARYLDEPIILFDGDTIEGETSNAATVDYVISGGEN